MTRYERFVDRVTSLSAYAAMLCVVLMVGHILLEIVLRNLFSRSTFVLEEFVGYATAAAAFFGLGAALRDGELIRVGLLMEALGPIPKRFIEGICALLGLTTISFLCWFLIRTVMRSWERGTTSTSILETPLWIPQSLVVIGLVCFGLQLSIHLLQAVTGRLPEKADPSLHPEQQDT
ncbi:TRAP transporter small permease subunit [Celeribacter halophilus]|uniref:TRAP transporter small permease subunit n=1 Tax=Celeribacter halophilus TaxID=576117 RepID=UPI003A8F510F